MKFEEAAQLKAEIELMPFWTAHIVIRNVEKGFSVQRDYGIQLTYQNPLTNVYISEPPIIVGTKEDWLRVKANIEPVKINKQQRRMYNQ